jgi:hypothetical protein
MAKNVMLWDYYYHGEMKSFLLMQIHGQFALKPFVTNYEPQAAILEWGLLVYWIHQLPSFSILRRHHLFKPFTIMIWPSSCIMA